MTLSNGLSVSLAKESLPHTAQTPDVAGSQIRLDKPFSQTLTCYAGIKPYAEGGLAEQRIISFDGDQLTISGGGIFDSGRFSSSGNPVERTDSATDARLHTQTGTSGARLWFTRNLQGDLISAGIVHRSGADRIECGAQYADQWLDKATSRPFGRDGNRLVWQTSSDIELNCIRYTGADFGAPGIEPPRSATLQLIQDGSMSVTIEGGSEAIIMLAHPDEPGRNASFVHETVRDGGQRIWLSRNGTDGNADAIRLRFRFNYNLLDIEHRQNDGQTIRCVPAPLDPRRFVES